jgi:uncharacterized protein YbcV (DUF1398 family)
LQKENLWNTNKIFYVRIAGVAIFKRMDTGVMATNVGVVMNVAGVFNRSIDIMPVSKALKSK